MKRTKKNDKKARNVPAKKLVQVKGGIEVDEDGFMEEPEKWSGTVAVATRR